MKTNTVIERIASLCVQNQNCVQANNTEWEKRSREELDDIAKNILPSGSGIDCGTKIDVEGSRDNRVVLSCQYHHMNEGGMYDGWTEHWVIVTACFVGGLSIQITGRDKNGIRNTCVMCFIPFSVRSTKRQ
jgi:hypothetical protein